MWTVSESYQVSKKIRLGLPRPIYASIASAQENPIHHFDVLLSNKMEIVTPLQDAHGGIHTL